MSTPRGFVDAPVYLQVEPRRRGGWVGSEQRTWDGQLVVEAAVVGHTLNRPDRPRKGTVVVKVTLRLPARAFDPLQPEAIVFIPADLTDAHPVEVEAQDPTGGAS